MAVTRAISAQFNDPFILEMIADQLGCSPNTGNSNHTLRFPIFPAFHSLPTTIGHNLVWKLYRIFQLMLGGGEGFIHDFFLDQML